jgi:ring-1,2-phenylacetyl-CoA epoxidase subunit PaaE
MRRDFDMPRSGEPILDAALRHGIDVPYSCRSGVCGTCRATLAEGEVDIDVNYALEDYEIARGAILMCQSYPVTASVTVDVDRSI